MNYCPDCGCKMYKWACTNCHEEIYIAEQYNELGMSMSPEFEEKLIEVENIVSKYSEREDVKRELKKI